MSSAVSQFKTSNSLDRLDAESADKLKELVSRALPMKNSPRSKLPTVKAAHKRQAARKTKMDKADLIRAKASEMKTYQITLRDRNGFTYTYIIQADPTSKSDPIVCASTVAAPRNFPGSIPATQKHYASSLPNMQRVDLSPEARRHSSCLGLAAPQEDLTKVGAGEKKGIVNKIRGYFKKLQNKSSSSSTGSASSSPSSYSSSSSTESLSSFNTNCKSKRKPKANLPKKRQRQISTKSNLDPIQESPEEEDSDSDSYTHDSASDGSLSES